MPDTTSYYDKHSRHILSKLELYFDGADNDPLVVDNSNHLIDYQIVEEASAETTNPLGAVSANELTITLANFNNLFSPSNRAGVYYGKIKTGVMVKVYIRSIEEDEWSPFGVYYVADWKAKMGSATAFVTCYDIIQDLLLSPIPHFDIKENITFTKYIKYVLSLLGFDDAIVDESLNEIIPYGFPASSDIPTLVQTLAEGAICIITSNRLGKVVVKKLQRGTIKATLTDKNQLKSLDSEQSIIKTYNGVNLTYVLPQVSQAKEILRVDRLLVPTGTFTHTTMKYPASIYKVYAATIIGSDKCNLQGYVSTNFGISVTTELSGDTSEEVTLSITGANLELLEQELNDNKVNMLQIYNPYVQTAAYAASYKEKLNRFVKSDIPILNACIRGNPELLVGDTIHIDSDKYKLSFIGIIKRATYKYAGNLSCELTLLNAEVVA